MKRQFLRILSICSVQSEKQKIRIFTSQPSPVVFAQFEKDVCKVLLGR